MKAGRWTEAEDEALRSMWRTHSHPEIAATLSRARNAVRNRCHRLGFVDTSGEWSEAELERLKAAYGHATSGNQIGLDQLAAEMGRHKTNISRKARALGLTDMCRKKKEERKIRLPKFSTDEERRKFQSEKAKRYIAEKGHPRGALGMKHTEEAKAKMAEGFRKWFDSATEEQKQEWKMKGLKTRAANGTMVPPRLGATWKAGWREIGGVRKYYRSKWEANYAHYLQWLKEKGQILDWKHEPETFWFEGIKRGCVSYLPDFWVKEVSGSEAYHEVKGWMDARSVTKIKRMAKYHPKVKLIVIDSKAYTALKKSCQGLVPGWEP
jgi:hypothetical protein